MPALAFGLKATGPPKAPAKRKGAFGADDDDDNEPTPPPQAGPKKASRPLRPIQPLKDESSSSGNEDSSSNRPRKSPKLSHPGTTTSTAKFGLQKPPPSTTSTEKKDYTNLSALRTASLHASAAAQLDSSAYAYDAVYDSFKAASSSSKPKQSSDDEPVAPKYMTSLLATTAQRKRDHERAREKAIQREREAEGDEFAGKEQFVTGAYKRQQEEMRVQEEEERKRAAEEEERRRKGVGMLDFNKRMLEREDERMRAVQAAEDEGRRKMEEGGGEVSGDTAGDEESKQDDAEASSKKGVQRNEDGDIIDKRQLLSAGLNVAPKKPSAAVNGASKTGTKAAERPAAPRIDKDARLSQRERQSRMIERQMETMAAQQAAEEEKAKNDVEEKAKSKITEDAKMGARERYLARKREAEEAKKQKTGG